MLAKKIFAQDRNELDGGTVAITRDSPTDWMS